MGFWVIIVALAVGVGVVLTLAMLRGRSGAVPAAAYDLHVYRDQLKEVDRDLARGIIPEAEAERTRTEVSRRLLAADAELRTHQESEKGPSLGSRLLALGLVVFMVASSILLYAGTSRILSYLGVASDRIEEIQANTSFTLKLRWLDLGELSLIFDGLGAPGYGDLPLEARLAASDQARAERLSQTEAEAQAPARPPAPEVAPDYLALMEKLRDTVKDRPDDLRGLRLLVRNEAALGNVVAAYASQKQVIRVKGPKANADDHALLADLMIAAAGGYVSTEAEAALRRALQVAPEHQTSRYYLGLYLMQVDRPDAAFRMWERLLRDSPADAPWVGPIRARIDDLAQRAGVNYQLPQAQTLAPRGPTAEDMNAAGDMTLEARQEMIRGMVSGLAARIENDGGAPEEWARLITAYGVLGETDLARGVWNDAQKAFWDAPGSLDMIRNSAVQAGVAE